MKTLRILVGLTKEVKSLLVVILLTVVFGVLGFFSAMALPVLGSMILLGFVGYGFPSVVLIAVLVLVGLSRGLFRILEHYTGHYVAFKILAIFRDKIFGKMRDLAPAKLDRIKTGELISLVTSDVEVLEVFYAHTLAPVMIAFVVSFVVVFIQASYVSLYLGLLSIIVYLILGVFVPMVLHLLIRKNSFEYKDSLTTYTNVFTDGVMGMNDLMVYKKIDGYEKRLNHQASIVKDNQKKMSKKLFNNQVIIDLFVKTSIVLYLIISLVLYNMGILGLSELLVGNVLFFSSFGSLIALANLPNNLNQTLVSGERILNLLNEKPVLEDNVDGFEFDYENLELEMVDFAYEENYKVIKNLNFKSDQKQVIGIYGASGNGKSTVLKLLMKFYDRDNGKISFNDFDIRGVNTSSLRDNLGLIMQDTYIFNKTIRDNIDLWGRHDDLAVEEACEKAGIKDFIDSLPEKELTMVGSNNRKLSMGEKQRIGLARIFLKNTKVILLDEPTANLDSFNESVILDALVKQKDNHTIIIVSHKSSTLNICDSVFRMDDGKLVLER